MPTMIAPPATSVRIPAGVVRKNAAMSVSANTRVLSLNIIQRSTTIVPGVSSANATAL